MSMSRLFEEALIYALLFGALAAFLWADRRFARRRTVSDAKREGS